MCEILTGMPPFFGENDEKIREVITKGQLEFQGININESFCYFKTMSGKTCPVTLWI